MKKLAQYLILIAVLAYSCTKTTEPEIKPGGRIEIQFVHLVNRDTLVRNSMTYVNEAGNTYEIDELKYFISGVYLTNHNGNRLLIDDQTAIHYVDVDYPATLKWEVYDPVPEGSYDSISFVFGLTEQRNVSFAFVNPPEVNMFWPDALGGGYHYLMINGKWKNTEGTITPFNFHLGIGQTYSGTTTSVDSITGFVHNYFRVALPLHDIEIKQSMMKTLNLVMDVNSWFSSPHTWDFNYWGGYIMQNQEAMRTAAENGMDVFTISYP